MVSGNGSHACLFLAQTVRAGMGNPGSAKAPTATLIISGTCSLSQNTFEPQVGQKWNVRNRPLSADRRKVRSLPSIERIWLRSKNEVEPNTAPVRRWQAKQWQDETSFGSPASLIRSCPQAQAASRSRGAVMPQRNTSKGRRNSIDVPAPARTAEDDRHVRRLLLFFAIVYVVEGIGQARVGIIYQPLTYFLKVTGWTPVEVTAYLAVLNFPWIIKPVFGLVSDFVPLFGYRRKSYLIVASVCAVGAYGWIARLSEPGEFALLLVLTSYAMATASTLCGALLAENGQSFRLSSRFVSQQWLWFYIAIMASSFAGGALIEHLRPLSALQAAAGIAAVAPVAMVLASIFLLTETKVTVSRQEMRLTFQSLVSAATSAKLHFVALFLFLYAFAPGFGTPLYYFMTDELKFSQAYIGILGSIASAGWIAGALVHRWLLARMSPARLLYLSIVLGTLSAASFLLLTDQVTAAIVNFANGAAMMIATIASLTLAADYCPRRSEGFAFAGLMSIMNLAEICSNTAGAFLYEHVFGGRLGPLIIVSAASTAVAAVLVPLLRLHRAH